MEFQACSNMINWAMSIQSAHSWKKNNNSVCNLCNAKHTHTKIKAEPINLLRAGCQWGLVAIDPKGVCCVVFFNEAHNARGNPPGGK